MGFRVIRRLLAGFVGVLLVAGFAAALAPAASADTVGPGAIPPQGYPSSGPFAMGSVSVTTAPGNKIRVAIFNRADAAHPGANGPDNGLGCRVAIGSYTYYVLVNDAGTGSVEAGPFKNGKIAVRGACNSLDSATKSLFGGQGVVIVTLDGGKASGGRYVEPTKPRVLPGPVEQTIDQYCDSMAGLTKSVTDLGPVAKAVGVGRIVEGLGFLATSALRGFCIKAGYDTNDPELAAKQACKLFVDGAFAVFGHAIRKSDFDGLPLQDLIEAFVPPGCNF